MCSDDSRCFEKFDNTKPTIPSTVSLNECLWKLMQASHNIPDSLYKETMQCHIYIYIYAFIRYVRPCLALQPNLGPGLPQRASSSCCFAGSSPPTPYALSFLNLAMWFKTGQENRERNWRPLCRGMHYRSMCVIRINNTHTFLH